MTDLPNETAILALHSEDEIAIYQRFFDRSTSGWRYRCGCVFTPESNEFSDFTALRKNNPGKVQAAVDRVIRLKAQGLSMAHTDSLELQAPDDYFLRFLADLQRFLSVNSLIVARHFREEKPEKIQFNLYAPIYNLIVALNFKSSASHVLNVELPVLMQAASEPGFRDDQYSNAAGSLRALADMLGRSGDDVRQLDALLLSQKLSANPGKAARIVQLMQKLGNNDEAQKNLQQALLKWPDDKPLKSLASARQ